MNFNSKNRRKKIDANGLAFCLSATLLPSTRQRHKKEQQQNKQKYPSRSCHAARAYKKQTIKLLNYSYSYSIRPRATYNRKKPKFVSVDLAMKAVRSFRCILAESLAPEQPILWCRVLFCVYNDGMLGHRTCNEATCDAMHPPALPFLPFSKSILNDFPHTHTQRTNGVSTRIMRSVC